MSNQYTRDSFQAVSTFKTKLMAPTKDAIPAIPKCAKKYRLMKDKILVLPIAEDSRIGSGLLFAAQTAQEKPSRGVIIAAGKGRRQQFYSKKGVFMLEGRRMRTFAKVGDVISFHSTYIGEEVTLLNGQKALMMSADDIICRYAADGSLQIPTNRLIVKLLTEETFRNGVYIPETALSRSQRGKVLYAGDGGYNEITGKPQEMSVKVGDIVVFDSQFKGIPTMLADGTDVVVMTEDDCLALLVPKTEVTHAQVA